MHDIVSNEIKTYTNNIPHTWDFSVHCKDAQHSPKRNKWKVLININKSHLNFLHHFIIMTQCQCQNHSYPTIMPVLMPRALIKISSCWAILGWFSNRKGVSWRRFVQIKQLAWPMAELQIEHWKSCLVLSARFPVINWRSRPVAQSAY